MPSRTALETRWTASSMGHTKPMTPMTRAHPPLGPRGGVIGGQSRRPGIPGANTLATNFAFELGKNCDHRRHGAAGRGGQVERLGEGDERNVEFLQLFECQHQVGEGATPPIQPPHRDDVDLASPGGVEETVSLRAPPGARGDLLDDKRLLPSPAGTTCCRRSISRVRTRGSGLRRCRVPVSSPLEGRTGSGKKQPGSCSMAPSRMS